jgi:hypothetical protein
VRLRADELAKDRRSLFAVGPPLRDGQKQFGADDLPSGREEYVRRRSRVVMAEQAIMRR